MDKFVVVLMDGMADYVDPVYQTPLVKANKPTIDKLAHNGKVGMCKTIPDGMKPGSDVANLSVLGYDPSIYYTGRSPLEALSIGVPFTPQDITYRCNLVTLSDDEKYENKTMVDYSSGEITTAESSELISFLDKNLHTDILSLYSGVSYRHCLKRVNGKTGAILTPPHDISDRVIGEYLPKGEYCDELIALMKKSYELLKNHPINLDRIKRGLHPANSMWLWGEGRKPVLPDFKEKYGISGVMISAVDLLKGIGYGANMTVVDVEGATGTIKTNFDGKAQAAIKALKTHDYVYVHLEAPDECGHQGNREEKQLSIELIDQKIIKPIYEYLRSTDNHFRILITPDHATPLCIKTHVSDPIPFVLYDSDEKDCSNIDNFNELTAPNTKLYLDSGNEYMKILLK